MVLQHTYVHSLVILSQISSVATRYQAAGQAEVERHILWVHHYENQLEPRLQGARQFDVLDDGLVLVSTRLARIGGGQQEGAGVQLANSSAPGRLEHLVEFVDTADAAFGQHYGAEHRLPGSFKNGYRQGRLTPELWPLLQNEGLLRRRTDETVDRRGGAWNVAMKGSETVGRQVP